MPKSFSVHPPKVSFLRCGLIAAWGLAAGCTVAVRPAPVAVVAPVPVAAVEVQANEAPPPLPVYEQPPCPVVGYIWTPGYWGYAPAGYYWVPGTWVAPPRVGLLWTPGYWGFVGGVYAFHAGYWGPHVGFYGGVNYGFGYVGSGYAGGHWVGNSFAYNTSVTNVNSTVIHNTYNETVINNVTVNRVSYNGGAGGVTAVASAQERAAGAEPHVAPTQLQQQHVQQAAANPALAARANGGHPAIAATTHPTVFSGEGVVAAKMAPHPIPAAPAAHAPAAAAPLAHSPAPAAHSPGTAGAPPQVPKSATAAAKHPKQNKQPHEKKPAEVEKS